MHKEPNILVPLYCSVCKEQRGWIPEIIDEDRPELMLKITSEFVCWDCRYQEIIRRRRTQK